MKVLMVTPSYYPILGGTETYVEQLAQKLIEKGVKTDVMTLSMSSKWNPTGRNETAEVNGIRLFRVSAHNPRIFNFHGHSIYSELFNVHAIPNVNFVREFENYDVIHFHDDSDFTFPLFSYFARALPFRKRNPRLWHLHTIPYTYMRYERNLLLAALVRRIADVYVGLSKFTMPFMLRLGLPQTKLVTVPNAIDTESFRPDNKKKADDIILFVGRIIPEKGLDTLVEALFHLRIQTNLFIIGPIGDEAYFSHVQLLMRRINDKGFHTVTYLGPLHGSMLIEWYQKATVFAAPSRADHFPMANLEALACGTPVVTTLVGAIPEVIENDVNGLLVRPNETRMLSSALQTLFENRKLREYLGKNGRELVEKRYSWSVVLGKFLEIYNRLLNA